MSTNTISFLGWMSRKEALSEAKYGRWKEWYNSQTSQVQTEVNRTWKRSYLSEMHTEKEVQRHQVACEDRFPPMDKASRISFVTACKRVFKKLERKGTT